MCGQMAHTVLWAMEKVRELWKKWFHFSEKWVSFTCTPKMHFPGGLFPPETPYRTERMRLMFITKYILYE